MKNESLKYCLEKGIHIHELSKITNVSVAQLYLINSDPRYNVTITTIEKIYQGTKERFGEGLEVYRYLDFKVTS